MQYAALMHMRQKKALQSIAQTATRLRMGVKYWLRSKPASSRATPENNFRTSHQERRKKPLLFEWQLNALNCSISRLYRQRGRNTNVCQKTPLRGIFGLFYAVLRFSYRKRDYHAKPGFTTELPQRGCEKNEKSEKNEIGPGKAAGRFLRLNGP